MPSMKTLIAAIAAAVLASTSIAATGRIVQRTPKLDSTEALDLVDAQADVADWHGRQAIHLSPLPGQSKDDHAIMAVLKGTAFHDGVIQPR